MQRLTHVLHCKYHKRQKFRGWKVLWFFPSPPSYIHGFPTLQNSYERFNESFAFLMLKLSLAYLEMDESTLLTHVCADFMLPGWPCSHRRRRATVEVSPRWNRLLTASSLASPASYFLISWQKPSRFFTTTVEYFLKYFKFFMVSTFSRAKV